MRTWVSIYVFNLFDSHRSISINLDQSEWKQTARRIKLRAYHIQNLFWVFCSLSNCLRGFFGNSTLPLADAIHFFSEFANNSVKFLNFSIANKPEDKKQPLEKMYALYKVEISPLKISVFRIRSVPAGTE